MSLDQAAHLAAFCYSALEKHGRRLVVVGSVRRGAAICHDIEIVLEPMMNADLFGGETPLLDPLVRELWAMGTIKKQGARYIQVVDIFGEKDVALDLFLCHPPAQWGSLVAIRTGPWQLSKLAVTRMRERGAVHQDGHAKDPNTGRLLPTPTEHHFFKLAGLPCVDPSQRTELAHRMGAME